MDFILITSGLDLCKHCSKILSVQLVGIPPSRCVLVTLLLFVQEIEALIDDTHSRLTENDVCLPVCSKSPEIKYVRARLQGLLPHTGSHRVSERVSDGGA